MNVGVSVKNQMIVVFVKMLKLQPLWKQYIQSNVFMIWPCPDAWLLEFYYKNTMCTKKERKTNVKLHVEIMQ